MSVLVDLSVHLTAIECGSCAMSFAVPAAFYRNCRDEGQSFRCPNPRCLWPTQSYKKTTNAALQEQLDSAKRRAAFEIKSRIGAQRREEHQRRRASTYKGHLTRTKKRISAGLCPRCDRTFENLSHHMHTTHPDYGGKAR